MKRVAIASGACVLLLLATGARAQSLAPPPPIYPGAVGAPYAPQPSASPTVRQLDDAEKEDSGRGLEFVYGNAEAGLSYMSLTSFSDTSLGLTRTDQTGSMLGAGVGVRLLVLTLGARFRYNMFSAYDLGQLDAVVGLHIPAGMWDPYIAIHGGYDFVGSFGDGVAAVAKQDTPASISVHGGNVGLAIGIDYYLFKYFSLGAEAGAEAIFLKRPPLALPAGVTAVDPQIVSNPLYQSSGSAAGFGAGASVHAGLHF